MKEKDTPETIPSVRTGEREEGGRQDFVLKRPAVHIQSPNLRLTNHDFGFTARLLGVRLLLP